MRTICCLSLLLAGCGPKATVPAAATAPAPAEALSTLPEIGSPPDWTPPAAESLPLETGAEAWLVSRDDLPLVSVRLWIPGGTLSGPAEHPGLVRLTDTMLMHGAGDRDAAAFAAHAEQLAIDLSTSSWEHGTVVSVDCHADRLDDGLALMADAVLRPRFAHADVERERDLQMAEIQRSLDNPRTVASRVGYAEWYGEGHPSAVPGAGTLAGLKGVTEKTVRADWARRSSPDGARFIVTGAVNMGTLEAQLAQHFGGWTGPEARKIDVPPARGVTDGPRHLFVDAPGSSQSVLRVILPGHRTGAEAEVATRLGAIVLGGTFTSRLNRLLREEKGYTYGARSSHVSGPDDGLLIASTKFVGT